MFAVSYSKLALFSNNFCLFQLIQTIFAMYDFLHSEINFWKKLYTKGTAILNHFVALKKVWYWKGNICKHRVKPSKSLHYKVEKILKGSLDWIPSSSPLVKIQIMDRKVCLRWKGKTLLGIVNILLKTNSMLTSPNNVLPYYLK